MNVKSVSSLTGVSLSIAGFLLSTGCNMKNEFAPLSSGQTSEASSSEPPSDTGTPPSNTSAATFQSINSTILAPKCLACHNANFASGGVSFATYTSTMKVVVPGAPAQSLLLATVKSGSMPRGAPRLSSTEVANIEIWILLGAKNDAPAPVTQ